jgi:hypothetical protein
LEKSLNEHNLQGIHDPMKPRGGHRENSGGPRENSGGPTKNAGGQGKTLVAAGKILDLLKTIQTRLLNQLKQLKPSFGFLFQLQFFIFI